MDVSRSRTADCRALSLGPCLLLAGAALGWGGRLLAASLDATAAPDRLFAMTGSLLGLQAGRHTTVHVLLLGDSHVASGPEPAFLGAALKTAFGDGGPGLVMPWTPPKFYTRDGVTSGSSPGWHLHVPQASDPPVDANLMGCYLEASRPGETAWAEGEASLVRLFALRQPGGGTVELLVDGKTVARESLDFSRREQREVAFRIPGPPGTHRIAARVASAGPVRILGLDMEKPGGIALTPLGVLGARAELPLLAATDETFGALLGALDPAVVLLAFGTNEAGEASLDPVAYTRDLVRLVERITHSAPASAVVLLGPPDRAGAGRLGWRSLPALALVVEAQRQAARLAGVRFLDRLAAMGGPGMADRWARLEPPLARGDRTHFTSEGYSRLASLTAAYTINVYNGVKASPEFAAYLRRSDADAATLLALAARPVPLPGAVVRQLAANEVVAAVAPAPQGARPVSTAELAGASSIAVVRNGKGGITITNYPVRARDGSGPGEGKLGEGARELETLRRRATTGGSAP